ncbi:hypothetical protein G7Y89_g8719 [Cudoniella acicularis]|uniref:Uncharacterized protein n=1 Tax=Cudoniella acicularis TaxID=354080 RepID=A0A8H4RGZ6_9HELO|nr:hypothetical protein G7Y89_g8719 [Cudoniella acicularis]
MITKRFLRLAVGFPKFQVRVGSHDLSQFQPPPSSFYRRIRFQLSSNFKLFYIDLQPGNWFRYSDDYLIAVHNTSSPRVPSLLAYAQPKKGQKRKAHFAIVRLPLNMFPSAHALPNSDFKKDEPIQQIELPASVGASTFKGDSETKTQPTEPQMPPMPSNFTDESKIPSEIADPCKELLLNNQIMPNNQTQEMLPETSNTTDTTACNEFHADTGMATMEEIFAASSYTKPSRRDLIVVPTIGWSPRMQLLATAKELFGYPQEPIPTIWLTEALSNYKLQSRTNTMTPIEKPPKTLIRRADSTSNSYSDNSTMSKPDTITVTEGPRTVTSTLANVSSTSSSFSHGSKTGELTDERASKCALATSDPPAKKTTQTYCWESKAYTNTYTYNECQYGAMRNNCC